MANTLFHFITLLSITSIIIISATAPQFEGFEYEEPDSGDLPISDLPRRPPPSTTLSTDHPPTDPQSDHTPNPNPEPNPETTSFEYWDEDEFEGFPTNPESITEPEIIKSVDSNISEPDNFGNETVNAFEHIPLTKKVRIYIIEIICITFFILFVINFFVGKKQNETLALSWASKFATRNTIFDKNFSLLGVGDDENDDSPLLLKEGQNVFKFYVSGRRFCQGLVATMDLKNRHDLITRIWNVVFPCSDEIRFEVYMNDDAMDHVVFALGKKKVVKGMQKEERDLQRFGSLISSGPSGRKWVADELMVVSESKEVAADLINESVIDQVFGEKAYEKFGKWLISMHFSDQQQSSHRKMLVFKFALPDANHMADMTRLVALVPYYIDLIGRYKLSSQARSKTEAARTKAAQEVYKELQNARQEALQRKKTERRKMMEEAESKLNAEAVRRKEAKERARQLKKAMPKIKMSRGG
uniref:uncharacterized protein At5g49945-like n=1 Tax=Erigeron canadensis TaxID=72917 RepID=UPI001CB9B8DA|nr:uncharacterized protein At5g49945-like [Erigeron canadensis]